MTSALIVVAAGDDEAARKLTARWAAHDARLLTPADLSCRGWQLERRDPRAGSLVVDGEGLSVSDLRGVAVRLARVEPYHLTRVAAADRAYVAAEMTALLTWWLTVLSCPVINRPVAGCLAGPEFDGPSWAGLARQLGVPTAGAGGLERNGRSLRPFMVVGTSCVDASHPDLANWSSRIASAVRVRALRVWFDMTGPAFVTADPWIDVSRPAVADALRVELETPTTPVSSRSWSGVSRPIRAPPAWLTRSAVAVLRSPSSTSVGTGPHRPQCAAGRTRMAVSR